MAAKLNGSDSAAVTTAPADKIDIDLEDPELAVAATKIQKLKDAAEASLKTQKEATKECIEQLHTLQDAVARLSLVFQLDPEKVIAALYDCPISILQSTTCNGCHSKVFVEDRCTWFTVMSHPSESISRLIEFAHAPNPIPNYNCDSCKVSFCK